VGTRLILIRHAHTDAAARMCGSFDVPLSADGRAQIAALVGAAPSNHRPDGLYTSPLTRARDVAVTLARHWSLVPVVADCTREIDCGALEGMALADVQQRYPELWARNRAQRDDDFAWPAGESYAQFRARVVEGVAAIAGAHPEQRVAIITHAGVVSQILGTLRGRSPAIWNMDRPDPFTATEVTWADGLPRTVLRYNDPHWY
jgi:broad specificity phosphatase PhoE